MSKLLIAQLAFLLVLAVAVVALGMEIFAGHVNPDVLLPWAYVAAIGWLGGAACAFLRLMGWIRRREKQDE